MSNKSKKEIGSSGNTEGGFYIPSVIFGTSGLGNLYVALEDDVKKEIVKEFITHSSRPAVFDSAGKYGAGLALESLGKSLKALGVRQEDVMISNKLGWYRTELTAPEPTFEPGVWRNLKHDAIQKISYEGILECFEQGNELLQGYVPQLVSVHDPDEYVGRAKDDQEYKKLYQDVLDGYKALADLKKEGKVKAIGVGAKDWRIIQTIEKDVALDWVMIANSMTIISHPKELLSFMQHLKDKNIRIINSAVFNGGFLVGGDYYNYKPVKEDTEEGKVLLQWRKEFFAMCDKYGITPAKACAQFGLNAPGVVSIAVSTTKPQNVKRNLEMLENRIPAEFWLEMKRKGLISEEYMLPDSLLLYV